MAGETNRSTYIALLRGINVGGNNKLPMRDLTTIFQQAACTEVRTYIQSGNVLFQAETCLQPGLRLRLQQAIHAHAGFDVPVVLRSAAEMRKALKDNPFVAAGADPSLLHVYFLADSAAKQAVAALDYDRSPGDSFVVKGKEIYLHLPQGVARTRLTNVYFDKQLGTVSTMRNWRTVETLVNLLDPV